MKFFLPVNFAICFCVFAISNFSQIQSAANNVKPDDHASCEIALVDWKTKDVQIVGEFNVLVSEGEYESLIVPLASTGKFIFAKVGVDDEGLWTEEVDDSVSMELRVTKMREDNIKASIQYAFLAKC